jgi:hypothetical protein
VPNEFTKGALQGYIPPQPQRQRLREVAAGDHGRACPRRFRLLGRGTHLPR